jgi:hypothetical protein
MKSVRTLRLLSLLGFLLLIAPFYDQCNGHGMKKVLPAAEEVMIDTTAVVIDTTAVDTPSIKNNTPVFVTNDPIINKDSIAEIKRKEIPFYFKAYEFIDDYSNENAFELANISRAYFEGSFVEFIKELIKDFKKHKYDGISLFIRSFSFVFIVLISFSILILSLLKRIKWVYKLSIVNITLIVITLICILFFDSLFTTYKQIKWGYYAFTLVQIGIYYTSKIQISSSKS